MAGNKPTLKTKSKDEHGKCSLDNGLRSRNMEPDLTILRKPIDTSITGFYEAVRVFDAGSDELRNLLGKECDVIYECKVCRNLFRSLANFVSHKRVYCNQTFNSKVHSHFVNSKFLENNTDIILQKEKEYQNYWNNRKTESNISPKSENEPVVPPITKDLTTIVERLTENSEITQSNNDDDDVEFCFEEIPSTKTAVFGNVTSGNKSEPQDTMKAQVMELNKLQMRTSAILNSDGKFTIEDLSNCPVIQISDDEDEDKEKKILECKTCNISFSTQKTLKFHMKKHYESRVVYPCTDCSDIFSTSWSVYRHLYKVHKKSAAQIKRLRESIQSKTFRLDRPPVHYKKKKALEKAANESITDAEKRNRQNKAWVDNMESDGVVQRCGGCGRSFERRAALASHSHICQRRAAKLLRRQQNLLNVPTTSEDILSKYSEEKLVSKDKDAENVVENSIVKKEIRENRETKVKAEMIEKELNENEIVKVKELNENEIVKEKESQSSEKNCDILAPSSAESENVKKCEKSVLINKDGNDIVVKDANKGNNTEIEDCNKKSEFDVNIADDAAVIEKENLKILDRKISKDIDMRDKLCKLCNTGYVKIEDLRRHLAFHYKWNRFICKICDFRCYDRIDCVNHLINYHNMHGDNEFYLSVCRPLSSTEAIVDERVDDLKSSKRMLPEDQDDTSTSPSADSKSSSISRGTSDDDSNFNNSKIMDVIKKKRAQMKCLTKPAKKQRLMESNKLNQASCNSDEDSQDEAQNQNKDSYDDKKPKTDLETVMQVIFGDESQSSLNINSNPLAYSRPTRQRTRPMRDDFEYDLSNITKIKTEPSKELDTQQTKTGSKRKQLLQNRSIAELTVKTAIDGTEEVNTAQVSVTEVPSETNISENINSAPLQSILVKEAMVPPLPKLTPAPLKKSLNAPGQNRMLPMPTLKRMPLLFPKEIKSSEIIIPSTMQESASLISQSIAFEDEAKLSIKPLLTSGETSEIPFDNLIDKNPDSVISNVIEERMNVDRSKNISVPKAESSTRKILIIKTPIKPVPSSSLVQTINSDKSTTVISTESSTNIAERFESQTVTLKPVKLIHLANLKSQEKSVLTNEETNENTHDNSSQNNLRDDAPMILTTSEKIGDVDGLDDLLDATNIDSSSSLNSDITNISKILPNYSLPK